MIDFTAKNMEKNGLDPRILTNPYNKENPPVQIRVRPLSEVKDDLFVQVFMGVGIVEDCYVFKVPSNTACEIIISPEKISARLDKKLGSQIKNPEEGWVEIPRTLRFKRPGNMMWAARLVRASRAQKQHLSEPNVKYWLYPVVLSEALKKALEYDLATMLAPLPGSPQQ